MGGATFTRGRATGRNSNCLIDSIRQALGVYADVQVVRQHLRGSFPAGPHRVSPNNYLDFAEHWSSTIDWLGIVSEQAGGTRVVASDYKVVCVDASLPGNGDVQGRGDTTLYLLRENMCHFVPMWPVS